MTPETSVPVVGTRDLPPDPTLAQAVGRHHTLESAIADLVDNSIDAEASRVHIRFLTRGDAVESIRIADNGLGMPEHVIDKAMTYAVKRQYGDNDLGHFGVGLKAASLSQADQLDVLSCAAGYSPVGRRIEAVEPTRVHELLSEAVGDVLAGARMPFSLDPGTLVEWGRPRNVLDSARVDERKRWLDLTFGKLRTHLGIVFHRMIEKGELAITLDQFAVDLDDAGALRNVEAIDPFGFPTGAGSSRDVRLEFELDGGTGSLRACVWPASFTSDARYRLFGDPGGVYQGIYAYRKNRLLQIGGWNHLAIHSPELDLVRIALEVDKVVAPRVAINPEKSGLEFDASLRAAITAATSQEGEDFKRFLGEGGDIRRRSRKYEKRDVTSVEPGRGFGPDVLRAFEESMVGSEHGPVDVRWRNMDDVPLEIDVERRTIWLNAKYRETIAPDSRGETADAPFLKTLVLLLFSRHFEGNYLGAFEKRQVGAWQDVLSAALDDELTLRRLRERDEPLA